MPTTVTAWAIERALSWKMTGKDLVISCVAGGVGGAVVVERVKSEKAGVGYNVAEGKFEDMMKAGIIDATKVTRLALQNAASVKTGHIVGASGTYSQENQAFLWDPSTQKPSNLPPLPNDGQAVANGINDALQIVGWSSQVPPPPGNPFNAVLWDSNLNPQILGSLGGVQSAAASINNAGQVVGGSKNGQGFTHAVLWNSSAPQFPTDLGVLEPNGQSIAYDINDSQRQQIVGSSYKFYDIPGLGRRPFPNAVLFDRAKDTVVNLNSFVPAGAGSWLLVEATAINNHGDIVGYGLYNNNYTAWMLKWHILLPPPPGRAVHPGYRLKPIPWWEWEPNYGPGPGPFPRELETQGTDPSVSNERDRTVQRFFLQQLRDAQSGLR